LALVVEITIKSDFTAADIVSHLSKLKNSPWHSEKRSRGGFRLYHSTTEKQGREGNIRLRRTKNTEDGHKRIYATSVGVDEVDLASKFIYWVLTHFRDKTIRITIV
jgi:hypothetical protein